MIEGIESKEKFRKDIESEANYEQVLETCKIFEKPDSAWEEADAFAKA